MIQNERGKKGSFPSLQTKPRNIDFFISTSKGTTVKIGKKLLQHDDVLAAYRSIGEPTIDLRIETSLKDNGDILEMLESIKGIEGVTNAVWSEIVEVIGKKEKVVN